MPARLEFWPFFGPFRVQKIIFSFRKIFSQYSVPYRTRSPWNSEHSTSSTVPHRITHRQTHGITTKAYSFNDVKYTVFSIYLIRNHEHIANITYSPSIIYSLGPEAKFGIPTLCACQRGVRVIHACCTAMSEKLFHDPSLQNKFWCQ